MQLGLISQKKIQLVPTSKYKYLDIVCLEGRFPSEICVGIGNTIIVEYTPRIDVNIPRAKTQFLRVHTPARSFVFVTPDSLVSLFR